MELLVTLGKALCTFKEDGIPFESNQMGLYLDKNKNSHLYLLSIDYRHCASTLNTFSHLIFKVIYEIDILSPNHRIGSSEF